MELKTLYDILCLNTLTSKQKAQRFFDFIHAIASERSPDINLYEKILETLSTEDVYKEFIDLNESVSIPDSASEMETLNFPYLLVRFLQPYIEWKNSTDADGMTNDAKRLFMWINKGKNEDVLNASEKLLNSFPDDENLMLANIAARTSLFKAKNPNEREDAVKETIAILEEILSVPTAKKHMFIYYLGLCYIALKMPDAALDKFDEALNISPGFEAAKVMKAALTPKAVP